MIKNCPLATIHILTYNAFDHIYVNLDSVLRQTYSNIEIVIADDGSKSFPKREIEDYISHHKRDNITNVVIIANEKNVGTVKNLNNAIRHSKGEVYIPLSQDDDFFSADVVERIMNRYIEHPYKVLITSRYGVNKNGEFQRFWPHVKARRIIEKMSTSQMFRAYSESWYTGLASGSVMNISADFIKEFGLFDERYVLWEDGPFFFKCLLQGYKIDTAYDIISIRYEQTEGVSNSPNQLIKKDIQLFLNTDFKLGRDDYGFMHKRYMLFLDKVAKPNKVLYRLFVNLLFLDVFIYRLYRSELLRDWRNYDKVWLESKDLVNYIH